MHAAGMKLMNGFKGKCQAYVSLRSGHYSCPSIQLYDEIRW